MLFSQFLSDSKDQIQGLANICIAFGTLVLAFGIPLSIIYSRRDERDTFYATLDRAYLDIQKMIIDYPYLANPGLIGRSVDQLIRYDAFAFITWNFMESIYDYSQGDKKLNETWQCILDYESKIHGAWFDEKRNRVKFKSGFCEYIDKKKQVKEVKADPAWIILLWGGGMSIDIGWVRGVLQASGG